MNKLFNSVAHFFSWCYSKVVAGITDVEKIIPTVEAGVKTAETVVDSPTVQALLTLFNKPEYAQYAQIIFGSAIQALTDIAAAGTDIEAALAGGLLNIPLDQAAEGAIVAVFNDIKAALGGKTITVPVAVSTPIPK